MSLVINGNTGYVELQIAKYVGTQNRYTTKSAGNSAGLPSTFSVLAESPEVSLKVLYRPACNHHALLSYHP